MWFVFSTQQGFPSLVPMQTLALDVVEECMNNEMDVSSFSSSSSKKNLNDLGFSLLSLIRDRLNTAAENIDVHLGMIQNVLPDTMPKPEPQYTGWDPAFCHRTECSIELFSIYVAVERKADIFECFCPSCFIELEKDNQIDTAQFKGFLFAKHSKERVLNAVNAIQSTLENGGCALPMWDQNAVVQGDDSSCSPSDKMWNAAILS